MRNGELHNLYASPNIHVIRMVKENEIGKTCSTLGREKKCIQGFGKKARKKVIMRKT